MSTLNAGTLNVTGALNLPNYTTAQRNAISRPAPEQIINNTYSSKYIGVINGNMGVLSKRKNFQN